MDCKMDCKEARLHLVNSVFPQTIPKVPREFWEHLETCQACLEEQQLASLIPLMQLCHSSELYF